MGLKKLVILLAVLLILGGGFYIFTKKESYPTTNVIKKEIPASQIPADLPQNIPLNTEAKVLENYEAQLKDGRRQATRVFESQLNVLDQVKEEELSSYDKLHHTYFEFLKSGWMVTKTDYTEDKRVVVAQKDNQELIITVARDPNSGKLTVSLNIFTK